MEPSLDRRGLVYRHRKLIAGSVIMFISLLLISSSPFIINQLIQVAAPAHSITVWISPVEEEFFLNLDFYGSEQDAQERGETLFSYGFRVEHSIHEQNRGFLINIPRNLLNMWVKIYFDEFAETHCNIHSIGIGHTVTSTLLDIEISILIVQPQ